MNLAELSNQVQKELVKRELLQENFTKTEEELLSLRRNKRNTEQAQLTIQEVAKKTQSELEFHISDMVTTALYSVFDQPYKFQLKFEIDREKTAGKIKFIREGIEINPKNGNMGGGVFDVAAFALRISTWKLKNPPTRPTFIIDEPFKHLNGEEYQQRAAELVRMLSDKLGIQFILVITDKNRIEDIADKVYKFRLVDKITVVREIK